MFSPRRASPPNRASPPPYEQLLNSNIWERLIFYSTPCLVCILMAGKKFKIYMRGVISLHSCNKPHSYVPWIRFPAIKMKQGVHFCSKGCQVVQRFVLKKSIEDKFWQYSGFILFLLLFRHALVQNSSTRPKVLILQGSFGQHIHLFFYVQFR